MQQRSFSMNSRSMEGAVRQEIWTTNLKSRISWWPMQVIWAKYHLGMFCMQIAAFSLTETIHSKIHPSAWNITGHQGMTSCSQYHIKMSGTSYKFFGVLLSEIIFVLFFVCDKCFVSCWNIFCCLHMLNGDIKNGQLQPPSFFAWRDWFSSSQIQSTLISGGEC